MVTKNGAIEPHDTAAKAARHAHRWLRRPAGRIVRSEWVTILDAATGAVVKRYVRRDDGRVERAQ